MKPAPLAQTMLLTKRDDVITFGQIPRHAGNRFDIPAKGSASYIPGPTEGRSIWAMHNVVSQPSA